MTKASTLERVKVDVSRGDLGKARDRLHGLIQTYPNDLDLRSQLAELYWKLQYPHMAGCYWYLEETQSDEARQAVELFEKRCGNEPWVIWHWIKFKGDPDSIPEFAKHKLDYIISECKRKYGNYPEISSGKIEVKQTKKQKISNAMSCFGYIAVLLCILFTIITGIRAIVGWFI